MTHRSVNVVQFWLAMAFLAVPPASFGIAGYLRFHTDMAFDPFLYVGFTIAVTVAWALMIGHFRLDRLENLSAFHTGTLTVGKATAGTMVLVLGILFFYREVEFSRVFVGVGCGLMFAISLIVLHSFRTVLLLRRKLPVPQLRVAIIGDDDYARRVAQQLMADRLMGCEIACFISPPKYNGSAASEQAWPWDSLEKAVETLRCQEVIVALSLSRFGCLQQILERAHLLCVPVRVVLDFGTSVPDHIFSFNGLEMLDVSPCPMDHVPYAVAKRAFDIVFSVLALLLTAPVTIVSALAIKLTSPGPVLFVQERVGLNGKPFPMLKFRTMTVQDVSASDTLGTVRQDPRVTRVGRFLRRTSLDEIPQFFNVLKGDMSIVGPRPERAHFVDQFRKMIPEYMVRHNIKCGITGWAQVNGLRGFDTSIAERIQYDLEYMRHWSMAMDVKIIARTVVSLTRNAY